MDLKLYWVFKGSIGTEAISVCFNAVLNLSAECLTNGTMTALALKVESVPGLIPSQLTLIDRSCKPVFSNDLFASFSFPVNSCGTARTVSFYFKDPMTCCLFMLL